MSRIVRARMPGITGTCPAIITSIPTVVIPASANRGGLQGSGIRSVQVIQGTVHHGQHLHDAPWPMFAGGTLSNNAPGNSAP